MPKPNILRVPSNQAITTSCIVSPRMSRNVSGGSTTTLHHRFRTCIITPASPHIGSSEVSPNWDLDIVRHLPSPCADQSSGTLHLTSMYLITLFIYCNDDFTGQHNKYASF